jgi:GNAT superfamily N-acetyltransferase
MHEIRLSVKENPLNNPDLVKENDYVSFLTSKGRGWLCKIDNDTVGFAIIDISKANVWALFVKPDFEKMGIGRNLHDLMLNWYFEQKNESVWLGTAPGTRAEGFYTKAGWNNCGIQSNGEIRFEMTSANWNSSNH